jgi:hypothetical protein
LIAAGSSLLHGCGKADLWCVKGRMNMHFPHRFFLGGFFYGFGFHLMKEAGDSFDRYIEA